MQILYVQASQGSFLSPPNWQLWKVKTVSIISNQVKNIPLRKLIQCFILIDWRCNEQTFSPLQSGHKPYGVFRRWFYTAAALATNHNEWHSTSSTWINITCSRRENVTLFHSRISLPFQNGESHGSIHMDALLRSSSAGLAAVVDWIALGGTPTTRRICLLNKFNHLDK